jgi:hypothetical protein
MTEAIESRDLLQAMFAAAIDALAGSAGQAFSERSAIP